MRDVERLAGMVSKSRGRRWILYTACGIGGLAIACWIALAILAARAEPYLKARVIRDLSERFNSTVELAQFRVSGGLLLKVDGGGVVLRHNGDGAVPPLITIRRFDFAMNAIGLLRRPFRISSVHLTGLTITLPPRGERRKIGLSGKPEKTTLFLIENIVCDDAQLDVLASNPAKEPLVFAIHSLVLTAVRPGQAMSFTARLTEPKPLGEIAAKGQVGPWQSAEPRITPVSGVYSFTGADLATIKGIGGILSSRGKFDGPLDRIEIRGETDTPDFSVSTGGHPMPLHTEFRATVDGSTGDTYLHPVRATLARSPVTAQGSVVSVKGQGHRITLDVSAADARIEDLLNVAIKTVPPTLSGPVSLKARLILPPGEQEVADRLQLDGSFDMPAARFSNPSAQSRIDQLSLRAQGKPKEAKQVAGSSDPPDEEILAQLHGKFSMSRGSIDVPSLLFRVPGASIDLSGNYQLSTQEFLFRGHARFEAKLSHMTTGLKSFFLRGVDPFFTKGGSGSVLPIQVSGTEEDPSIRVAFGHHADAAGGR